MSDTQNDGGRESEGGKMQAPCLGARGLQLGRLSAYRPSGPAL